MCFKGGTQGMTFYDKYKALCDAKGITPAKAAVEMGFNRSTPSKWKAIGSITPKLDTVQKVADYFGISVDSFVAEDDHAETGDNFVFDLADILARVSICGRRVRQLSAEAKSLRITCIINSAAILILALGLVFL
jgi:transcriptional regulator with XRE-family HTH domain